MDIMESPLGQDIEKITKNDKGERYYWAATIHSGDYDHDAMKVLNVDLVRDYEKNFSDKIILTCLLAAGKYSYRLMPNLHQTEITLRCIPIHQTVGGYDSTKDLSFERYTAVMQSSEAPSMESNTQQKIDEHGLDLSDIIMVQFQLVPKAMEQFRMRSVGGIYRKCKIDDIVKTILLSESEEIDVDNDYKPKGVDMVEPTDKRVREQVIVPHGTMATDSIAYLHKHCGGIYSAGLSYYYQSDFWFVFPTFDNTRFNEVEETLTIINVPENRMPGTENTYIKEGKNLMIVSTGAVAHSDEIDQNQLSSGNGVRFTNPESLKGLPVKVEDNKATFSRAEHNSEFKTTERFNGLDNAVQAPGRITANSLYEYSRMAARDGALISMVWENSIPRFITPGMQVKIMYMSKDDIAEVEGIVVFAHHSTTLAGQGVMSNRHVCTSKLAIFTKRIVEKPKS